MKKLFVLALAMFAIVSTANAQISNDIKISKERVEKLQSLCDGYKKTGNPNIDGYGDAVRDAAVLAIANSVQLEDMYNRQISEAAKPTIDEWVTFANGLAKEGECIKKATDKVKAAGEEAKTMSENASKEKNPMKAGKAAKQAKTAAAVVSFGNEATPIIIEESAAQAKVVKEIIDALKSGKEL